MSGATAGSGGALGPDENDGKLMLPHPPRNAAIDKTIPRLRTARVLFELIMAFSPNQTLRPHPCRSQAQNSGRSNHVGLQASSDTVWPSILYRPHQGIKPLA